jgi:hypothetical protein
VRAQIGSAGHDRTSRIVRCIILRNVLSGRIGRLIYRERIADVRAWLEAYVRQVAGCYTSMHDEWRRLQSPDGQLDLHNMLFTFACGHIKVLHLTSYNIEAWDIANEAYCQAEARLRRYPFDLPLRIWLDRHVRECARSLYHMAPAHVALLALTDINEEYEALDIVGPRQYDRLDDSLDVSIDLSKGASSLSATNLHVLRMWVQGYTLQETANHLRLTPKAVANRRNRIQKQIRAFA